MELRTYQTECIDTIEAQPPGAYLAQMATGLGKTVNRVKGKYMYRKTAAELPQIAERGAQEIEKKAMAYLEGKG